MLLRTSSKTWVVFSQGWPHHMAFSPLGRRTCRKMTSTFASSALSPRRMAAHDLGMPEEVDSALHAKTPSDEANRGLYLVMETPTEAVGPKQFAQWSCAIRRYDDSKHPFPPPSADMFRLSDLTLSSLTGCTTICSTLAGRPRSTVRQSSHPTIYERNFRRLRAMRDMNRSSFHLVFLLSSFACGVERVNCHNILGYTGLLAGAHTHFVSSSFASFSHGRIAA
ncbi:hypothetical protein C8Q78DRAFT_682159 [Trametes maxima]|nr:hypothetical protein C8Q78DRAFT_682159 [Trametes maxima]